MAAYGSQASSTGSTTRAFAQKLNKFRRNGSATFSTQSSTRSQSSTSSSFIHLAAGTIPLNEVVEPPDFEEILLQNQPFNEKDRKSVV